MPNIWIVMPEELPPPQSGYDLALWCTHKLVSDTKVRTWAGWSETAIIAHDIDRGQMLAFDSEPSEWLGTDLVVGSGRVWRMDNHYIAWLDPQALSTPEVGRALALAGIDLIVAYSDSGPSPFLDPLWRVVQSEQIFGLALGNVPRLYLPCEADPDEDGVQELDPVPGGFRAAFNFRDLLPVRRLLAIHQGLRPGLYKSFPWWTI